MRGLQWKAGFLISVPRKTLFAFVVIITMTQIVDYGSASSRFTVVNNIGDNQILQIECHSARGDPYPRQARFLQPGEEASHSFDGWVETWKCEFHWENYYQKFVVWDHGFDSPMPVKCGQCLWSARPDGWWVWDKSTKDWKFYVGWVVV